MPGKLNTLMTKDATQKATNFQPSAAFHLVVIALLSFGSWEIADRFVAMTSIPWGIITILVAPIAYSITLFHKLSETTKNVAEDLSKDEARRLRRLINHKRNLCIATMIIQIIIVAFMAVLSLSGQLTEVTSVAHKLSNLAVVTVIISLYSFIPSVLGVKEVNDFEAIIKSRKAQNKRTNATLKKLM